MICEPLRFCESGLGLGYCLTCIYCKLNDHALIAFRYVRVRVSFSRVETLDTTISHFSPHSSPVVSIHIHRRNSIMSDPQRSHHVQDPEAHQYQKEKSEEDSENDTGSYFGRGVHVLCFDLLKCDVGTVG